MCPVSRQFEYATPFTEPLAGNKQHFQRRRWVTQDFERSGTPLCIVQGSEGAYYVRHASLRMEEIN